MKITVKKEDVENYEYYLWNRFIECLINEEFGDDLSRVQQIAKLCFWYDAEMNNGGHSGYFDCYADENFDKVEKALMDIGAEEYSKNFKIAVETAGNDGYISTDGKFGELTPGLTYIVEKYVMDNINEFFIIE
ncbi:DUF4375 domain-containing protein [Clostridium sp. C8-1-8]|uniref:DMP19 family protein n=1 Tax=Clostridium sp. C8-1-8 TaxID=2698831 RepID=UPI0013685C66|nr:DUF4375 domain-containing protein [Clostridium sp. C8-1-8]